MLNSAARTPVGRTTGMGSSLASAGRLIRSDLADALQQHVKVERLRHVLVVSGGEDVLSIAMRRKRRQRDRRQPPAARFTMPQLSKSHRPSSCGNPMSATSTSTGLCSITSSACRAASRANT